MRGGRLYGAPEKFGVLLEGSIVPVDGLHLVFGAGENRAIDIDQREFQVRGSEVDREDTGVMHGFSHPALWGESLGLVLLPESGWAA